MATSIREALESAVSSQEAKESSIVAAPEVVEPAPAIESVVADAAPIGETAEQKSDRLRDEKGRFAEGKAPVKVEPVPQAATPAPVIKLPKPDSWKKEWQGDWDTLTPKQQEIAKLREDQYFKGVSTYQQEWKSAKPLLDAVAPFLPELQKHNIAPEQWISNLGRAHHTLATGDGQTKLQMFAKLAQDYGVPLQALYDPNFAQQFVSQQLQQPRPVQQQEDVGALVDKKFNEWKTQSQIEEFKAAKDAAGQPLYPHFDKVAPDMGLLLEHGKAPDLKSAYSMALRLHDDLFAAEQEAKTKAAEAARLDASRKAVAVAKGSAVSVKSATPATTGSAPTKGSRREQLEAAYDLHMNGRV